MRQVPSMSVDAQLQALLLALLATAAFAQHDSMHGGMMGGMVGMNGSMGDMGCPQPLDICVTEPTRDNCTLPFKLPHPCSVADATRLCSAMHFMTACSVAKACNASGADWAKNAMSDGRLNVSRNNDNICRPFQHVVTVCKLDTGMSKMAGCRNFNSMCVEGSKVDMCTNVTGLTELPTTALVNEQLRLICEREGTNTTRFSRCAECTGSWSAGQKWGDCDLLDVYSNICAQQQDMSECAAWRKMCEADPTLWWCKSYLRNATTAAAGVSDDIQNATAKGVSSSAVAVEALTVSMKLMAVVLAVLLL